jgi:hypothetical protein
MSERSSLVSGARLARRADVFEAEVNGEVIALNVDTAECYGLNRVGSRIWRLLAEPRTAAEIREVLLAEYEADPADCERSVQRLLAELLDEGLIELAAG